MSRKKLVSGISSRCGFSMHAVEHLYHGKAKVGVFTGRRGSVRVELRYGKEEHFTEVWVRSDCKSAKLPTAIALAMARFIVNPPELAIEKGKEHTLSQSDHDNSENMQ